MAMNFKKWHKKIMTYDPKDNSKEHKHNYSIECVLEVTNANIHASSNYYNSQEYYNVLKCDVCNSFIPKSEEGNFSGLILAEKYNKNLPLITAKTNMKCPLYTFYNLFDVVIHDKRK